MIKKSAKVSRIFSSLSKCFKNTRYTSTVAWLLINLSVFTLYTYDDFNYPFLRKAFSVCGKISWRHVNPLQIIGRCEELE